MSLPHTQVIRTQGNQRRVLPDQSVSIRRGAILLLKDEDMTAPMWRAQSLANGARILATNHFTRGSTVFTHESAMIAHGLAPWCKNPNVSLRPKGRCNRKILPALRIGEHSIASVHSVPTQSTRLGDDAEAVDGVLVDSLETTALLMAASRPPTDAIVAVSQIVRRLSKFDRFLPKASRAHEAGVKAHLLERLSPGGDCAHLRGASRAGLLIAGSDAGCESVGEAALLTVLLTLEPQNIRTQYEIVANGNTYFADFALPKWRIVIEFDGVIKMGTNEREFHQAQAELMARQRDLEDAGWTVVRVGWKDLLNLDALRAKLLARILRVQRIPTLPSRLAEDYWRLHL
ncbi:endonuclease domain-containing protein [Schaalia vaccimaxillae]|uniref:endonuclease domain-containing protein n=1 Tax=Schaalia vaccimaxillae TaxID=183916 RepID=UPI0003B77A34|nr:hypothetical protein [Schaalia vaccimaxillae]